MPRESRAPRSAQPKTVHQPDPLRPTAYSLRPTSYRLPPVCRSPETPVIVESEACARPSPDSDSTGHLRSASSVSASCWSVVSCRWRIPTPLASSITIAPSALRRITSLMPLLRSLWSAAVHPSLDSSRVAAGSGRVKPSSSASSAVLRPRPPRFSRSCPFL